MAFDALEEKIISPPLLGIQDIVKHFVLLIDAWCVVIGIIPLREMGGNQQHRKLLNYILTT